MVACRVTNHWILVSILAIVQDSLEFMLDSCSIHWGLLLDISKLMAQDETTKYDF